ncbi:MAG: response regulator [Ignavibacteriales bacterium]
MDPETKDNLLFVKEWENILTLLVRENSLEALADEFLMRSVNLTHSSFGILLFADEEVKTQIDYRICDKNGLLKDKGAIGEIRSSLSYIIEWFKLNRRSLTVKSTDENNIAYNIISELQAKYLVITPSFTNNSIMALSLLVRNDLPYTPAEISGIEQFSSILAFAVNNLLTSKLNAALENKLQQSQKLETIGKLASGMAHDFNNLLSSIFGSLNLLKRKLADKPEVFYLLENIEKCSARAADLTKGLLSYGKPTAKRKTLIKPDDLLKELMIVINQTFPDSIEVEKNFQTDLHDILGNATEIYQVLLNLCINAKEAIKGKGKITIETKNVVIDEKKKFDFPLLNQGSYVCFTVKDTGEGISDENLNKIFDPYFSTKQKDTGSGLGLYVTYGIVKAHGGIIDVSSKPNAGTEFNVYVPSFDKSAAADVPRTEKIILLADDETMLRDILAELLESYDFQVISVQNGLEVLHVLTEEIKVDLLIIDYKMPEMDGMTCIKKIRELNIQVPVILSTGSSTPKTDEEFKSMKIDSILTKPYEFERMLEEVKKLI